MLRDLDGTRLWLRTGLRATRRERRRYTGVEILFFGLFAFAAGVIMARVWESQ